MTTLKAHDATWEIETSSRGPKNIPCVKFSSNNSPQKYVLEPSDINLKDKVINKLQLHTLQDGGRKGEVVPPSQLPDYLLLQLVEDYTKHAQTLEFGLADDAFKEVTPTIDIDDTIRNLLTNTGTQSPRAIRAGMEEDGLVRASNRQKIMRTYEESGAPAANKLAQQIDARQNQTQTTFAEAVARNREEAQNSGPEDQMQR